MLQNVIILVQITANSLGGRVTFKKGFVVTGYIKIFLRGLKKFNSNLA